MGLGFQRDKSSLQHQAVGVAVGVKAGAHKRSREQTENGRNLSRLKATSSDILLQQATPPKPSHTVPHLGTKCSSTGAYQRHSHSTYHTMYKEELGDYRLRSVFPTDRKVSIMSTYPCWAATTYIV